MYRTTQNLLNLKEPILSKSKCTQSNRLSTFDQNLITDEIRTHQNGSSDSSMHSSSSSTSSSNRNDDRKHQCMDNVYAVNQQHYCTSEGVDQQHKYPANNLADDESGFSSLNSFHHENGNILLPLQLPQLNSTMISNQFCLDGDNDDALRAMPIILPSLPIMNKKWEQVPPIPPKKNFATMLSTKQTGDGDEQKSNLHVLWV